MFDLIQRLILDDSQYHKALDNAESGMSRTAGRIGGLLDAKTAGARKLVGSVTGIAGAFTGILGTATLVTGAVGGLVALMDRGATRQREIADQAERERDARRQSLESARALAQTEAGRTSGQLSAAGIAANAGQSVEGILRARRDIERQRGQLLGRANAIRAARELLNAGVGFENAAARAQGAEAIEALGFSKNFYRGYVPLTDRRFRTRFDDDGDPDTEPRLLSMQEEIERLEREASRLLPTIASLSESADRQLAINARNLEAARLLRRAGLLGFDQRRLAAAGDADAAALAGFDAQTNRERAAVLSDEKLTNDEREKRLELIHQSRVAERLALTERQRSEQADANAARRRNQELQRRAVLLGRLERQERILRAQGRTAGADFLGLRRSFLSDRDAVRDDAGLTPTERAEAERELRRAFALEGRSLLSGRGSTLGTLGGLLGQLVTGSGGARVEGRQVFGVGQGGIENTDRFFGARLSGQDQTAQRQRQRANQVLEGIKGSADAVLEELREIARSPFVGVFG